MRSVIKFFSILLIVLCVAACGEKQGKQISAVIPIAENKPDSALSILNMIDQTRLSDKDFALYSLVYTMAQDKSGLDVDNDSLLRNAYNWYKDKPTDSLYAKCEYYMGKYYSLNDSSEKALNCFTNSIKAAKHQKDYYTQSMALLQSSVIVREYNPSLAISYAKDAINIYNKVKYGPMKNKVYGLLNLAECYSYEDNEEQRCISLVKQAINLAHNIKDSLSLADSYQDLSVFYGLIGANDSALLMAKKHFSLCQGQEPSALYSLAQAYYNVDSLDRSKKLALRVLRLDSTNYGSAVYSLLHMIALKEGDYDHLNAFKDSLLLMMETQNSANCAAKDSYYSKLIGKEKLRINAQNENHRKTDIIITIIIISVIVVILSYAFRIIGESKYRIPNSRNVSN